MDITALRVNILLTIGLLGRDREALIRDQKTTLNPTLIEQPDWTIYFFDGSVSNVKFLTQSSCLAVIYIQAQW